MPTVDLSNMTMRQRFEWWYSDEGQSPKAIEKDGRGSYLLLQTANAWRVWQAADEAAQVAYGVGAARKTGDGTRNNTVGNDRANPQGETK